MGALQDRITSLDKKIFRSKNYVTHHKFPYAENYLNNRVEQERLLARCAKRVFCCGEEADNIYGSRVYCFYHGLYCASSLILSCKFDLNRMRICKGFTDKTDGLLFDMVDLMDLSDKGSKEDVYKPKAAQP